MNRRNFFVLAAFTAGDIWPRTGFSQRRNNLKLVAVLLSFGPNDAQDKHRADAFRRQLELLGWIEGRNIDLEFRSFGGDPDQARRLGKELLSLGPDVVVGAGTSGLEAFARETRQVPIVFVAVSDPVQQGFVTNLARPGGNITGFTLWEFKTIGKGFQILKDLILDLSKITAIFHPDNPSSGPYVEAAQPAASSLGINFIPAPVRSTSDLERVIDALKNSQGHGLSIVPDPFTNTHRELVIKLADRNRVPAIYGYRHFSEAGGLVSYGVDAVDLYRRGAEYVDRILKGAQPGDLPVEQPNRYELILNLKTARKLALEVPEHLLASADKIID